MTEEENIASTEDAEQEDFLTVINKKADELLEKQFEDFCVEYVAKRKAHLSSMLEDYNSEVRKFVADCQEEELKKTFHARNSLYNNKTKATY